jgi:predicted N-acyltransferase
MAIKITPHIDNDQWNSIPKSDSPFLGQGFFEALTESGSIGGESGWQPLYIHNEEDKGILYSFIKNHSYGEYIFDWDWANGFAQNGLDYYPKLTSMIPLTSATTDHFLGNRSQELMEKYEEFYNSNPFSSSHFLFLQRSEIEFFKSFGYIIRDSFQYHFFNKSYTSFEHFLEHLKSRKAKQIRKERKFKDGVEFNRITGQDLTPAHAKEMYQFYLSTIDLKQAISYLKEDFFTLVFEKCKEDILYVQATHMGNPIAGALYFFSSEVLYGRYWGANFDVPNLHFELCYYQGIEFCIENQIKIFEAGAQGEHKISRGFEPTLTYSAHKIKHVEFHKAIENYILNERKQIKDTFPILCERLPFKN